MTTIIINNQYYFWHRYQKIKWVNTSFKICNFDETRFLRIRYGYVCCLTIFHKKTQINTN